MTTLADRITRIEPSPTLAITTRAQQMAADGVDVISFSAGEPDFDTPPSIRQAAKRALDGGKTRYTPTAGIPQLRQAIADDYERRDRAVDADQVVVTVGGKHALYNASQVLFDEGDKVVVPAPYWVSYPAQIMLTGAEPISIATGLEDDFKLSPDQLAAQLDDPSVRGVIFCSPSNPTGACYTRAELEALGTVLARRPDVAVLFDAMYDRLYYDEPFAPDLVATVPELADRTITFNGFSKTYAMTGWRMGYAIGPRPVIAAMAKLQSQSTSNATSFAQWGGLEALQLDDAVIDQRRQTFEQRRDVLVDDLNAIDGVRCATPDGAFYAFPDISSFVGERFDDDLAVANYLLEQAHVAVVPGSAFGAPGYIRMSYATGDAAIEAGIERIRAALVD